MIPLTVRAIFFDAVGTLIHPEPPAITVYERVGRQFGSQLSREVIEGNFRQAFSRQDAIDRDQGFVTSESREIARWQAIVADSLADISNADQACAVLFAHFARSTSWRWHPDAGPVLKDLSQRGFILGMASNFDSRLRSVLAQSPEMAPISQLVISSEVGWRKPAPAFFAYVCRSVGLAPPQVLHVGDDVTNDYQGARDAGLHSLLLTSGKTPCQNVQSLRQLPMIATSANG